MLATKQLHSLLIVFSWYCSNSVTIRACTFLTIYIHSTQATHFLKIALKKKLISFLFYHMVIIPENNKIKDHRYLQSILLWSFQPIGKQLGLYIFLVYQFQLFPVFWVFCFLTLFCLSNKISYNFLYLVNSFSSLFMKPAVLASTMWFFPHLE